MVPTTPVRGAGRPNAASCWSGSPTASRASSSSTAPRCAAAASSARDQFPYATGTKARDGSPVDLRQRRLSRLPRHGARAAAGRFSPRARTRRARKGRYLGLGIASYVEDTGLGPFEGAQVRVEPNGKVVIATGAAAQGQGHATVFAQIAADILDVPLEHVSVVAADTGALPAAASAPSAAAIAVTGGSSVHIAATPVRDKAIKVAAEMLEAGEADLALDDGRVRVAGTDRVGRARRDRARARRLRRRRAAGRRRARARRPSGYFEAGELAFANGTQLCEVEVDLDDRRGEDRALCRGARLRAADQSAAGRRPDPGRRRARHRQRAATSTWRYDDDGQPLTTNYADYLLPVATDMPPIEIIHLESPSPLNPLGVKGAGEGGTIPATACVISAIEDALSSFGVTLNEHPVSPQRIVELIGKARRVG